MPLDSFTILVACCGILILVGGILCLLWFTDRRANWLLWWGIPLLVNGFAAMLYMRPHWDTDPFSIVFGNAARIIALGGLWWGVRLFEGQRAPWRTMASIMVLWFALCLSPPFIESMTARIAVTSLLSTAICALIVGDLWRARGDGIRARMPTLVVFASYGLFMLARAAASGVAPFPVGGQPLDPAWFAAFVWLIVAHVLLVAFLLLTMTMERRIAEQRNFAMSDPLTGLMNRRAFSEFAPRIARRGAGLREPLALLVLDLDRFKRVNDRFGHEAGDRLLKAFADVAEANVRPTDQLFRMGGEEFCFILPDTSLNDAIAVAERVRSAFEAVTVVGAGGESVSSTVSIGVAVTHFAIDADVLLAAADAALYEAKARGRNCVIVADAATLLEGQSRATETRRRA